MNEHSYRVRELPQELEILADLATDLRWTWSHAGDALWKVVDPQMWEQRGNPYIILQNLPLKRLEELAKDHHFRELAEHLAEERDSYYKQSGWYNTTYPGAKPQRIAYFSMEFGLGESLPLYAGGLGILAGDYLKAASDLGVPVIGVGLLYQQGYFRQMLDANGWQQNVYTYNDPASLPIQPMISNSGSWLNVTLEFPGRPVRFRVWKAIVGRVVLYLLDSNDPLNSPSDRGITSKLYGGAQELRLCQEIALGIGGWQLLEKLGEEIDVCHLNEGHAAFVTLERARLSMERNNFDFQEALWATRSGNIFTTHTPVAAGFDTFNQSLFLKYGNLYAERLGISPEALAALGKLNPENLLEPFNMAYLALRTCLMTNGVSKLHGVVSRRIFQNLYPRWPERELPVMHITNGVHVPSWDSPWADETWTQAAGKERWRDDPGVLAKAILENLSDETLWNFAGLERAEAYNKEVGWSLGDGKEHPEPGWDGVEAEELYLLLEKEVIPEFYKRDATGIPRTWVAHMRASMMHLAPYFSSNRMMKEYVEKMYLPAAAAYELRIGREGWLARELQNWELTLRQHWHGIHWGNLEVREDIDGWSFDVQVYLGEISPDLVQVQLFADPTDKDEPVKQEMARRATIPGCVNGYHYYDKIVTGRPAADFSQRIIANHPDAVIPGEMNLISWRPT